MTPAVAAAFVTLALASPALAGYPAPLDKHAPSVSPAERLAVVESTLDLSPLFASRTKAVTGFALGSLAGLLFGGRKKKDALEEE